MKVGVKSKPVHVEKKIQTKKIVKITMHLLLKIIIRLLITERRTMRTRELVKKVIIVIITVMT